MSRNHRFYVLHQCAMHSLSLRSKKVRDTELMIDQLTRDVVKSEVEINALIGRLNDIYHINCDELTPLKIPLWLINPFSWICIDQ